MDEYESTKDMGISWEKLVLVTSRGCVGGAAWEDLHSGDVLKIITRGRQLPLHFVA